MDDQKIVDLYWERSETAIKETQRKYGKYCHAIAYAILHSDEDAEECVNDTLLRTWNSIPPASPSVLKTYLAKITRNLALDRYKNTHRAKRGCGEVAIALDEISEITDSGYDVQDAWREQEFISLLNDFLHALRVSAIFLCAATFTPTACPSWRGISELRRQAFCKAFPERGKS